VEERILESWKEIAGYLRRTPKTCQRWEHELGLPIHRLDGSPKASVFAYQEELDHWLNEKLHERESAGDRPVQTGPRRRSRIALPAVLSLALGLAAFLLWRYVVRKPALPFPEKRASLAVVYFENLSGDPKIDYWRSALAELLIADLAQSKYLRLVPSDEMYSILRDLGLLEARKYSSEDLSSIAAAGRAAYVLTGTYVAVGRKFLITAAVRKIEAKETLSSSRVEAEGDEEIFARVDDLTRRIKFDLDLSEAQMAGDFDRDIGQITTSSPEAYRLYSDAWKLTLQMKSRESIPLLEKALTLDPEFAMAYRLLGIVYVHLDQWTKSRSYQEKALALSDRISETERYLVEAAYDMLRGERYYDRAVGALSKYLERNPEAYASYNQLGMIYVYLGEWDQARELFERAQAIKPEYVISLANLANMWMVKGESSKAIKTIERHLERYPDNPWLRRGLAFYHVIEKDNGLARVELGKATVLDPLSFHDKIAYGDLSLFEGDLAQAESEYRSLLEREDPQARLGARIRLDWLAVLQGKFASLRIAMSEILERARGGGPEAPTLWQQYLAAWYFLKAGDPETALKAFRELQGSAEAAEDLDYERRALHGQGLACLALGRMDEALEADEELRRTVESKPHKAALLTYHHLGGCLELERGNLKPAIENLEESASLMGAEMAWGSGPQAMMLDPLARAYLRAGRREQAVETYRKIAAMTCGRLRDGDIYAKAFYLLGKIADEEGDEAQARESYGKFLELWKDADPGLPELEEAKKRLADLTHRAR
jgi:tetratricopeptide (TPR) repeat protein